MKDQTKRIQRVSRGSSTYYLGCPFIGDAWLPVKAALASARNCTLAGTKPDSKITAGRLGFGAIGVVVVREIGPRPGVGDVTDGWDSGGN